MRTFKRCPFCGGYPEIMLPQKSAYADLVKVVHRCENLGFIELKSFEEDMDTAIRRWNDRKVGEE